MTTLDELDRLRAVRDAVPPPTASTRSAARDRVMTAAHVAAAVSTPVLERHRTDRAVGAGGREVRLAPVPTAARPRPRPLALAAAAVATLLTVGLAWQALGPRSAPAPLIDEGREDDAPVPPLPVETLDAVDITGEARADVLGSVVLRPVGPGPWPTAILFGGFHAEQLADVARDVAESGAVVHVVDVVQDVNDNGTPRFFTPAVLREMVQRTTCALRHVTATAQEHGDDPDDVVVVTFAEGGWVTALSLLAGDQLGPEGPCTITAPPAVPRAVVSIGSYWVCEDRIDCPDLGDAATELSPFTYVDRHPETAFWMRAPGIDVYAQPEVEAAFADALRGAGHDVHREVVDGLTGITAFADVDTPAGAASVDLVVDVLRAGVPQDE